jgi:hypothetical protein
MNENTTRKEVMLDQLARELAEDIFLADGGVDDFDSLSHAELLLIVIRELPNHLADIVASTALSMQNREI